MATRINSEHLLTRVRDANIKLGGILWVEREGEARDRWTIRKGNEGAIVESHLTTREACFFVSGMEFAAYLAGTLPLTLAASEPAEEPVDAGPADVGDAGQ